MEQSELKELVNNKIAIGEGYYYDVDTFAKLTRRSVQAIRNLYTKGNRLGILEHIKIGGASFIPESELTEFRFATVGRSRVVLRYDKEAKEHVEYV